MYTTLNKIRAHRPCADGWTKLRRHLGKTKPDDEPVSIITVLDSNGLGDALWCLRAVDGHDREIRLYGVWCARQVQHLMTDPRSIAALDVVEQYANGLATQRDLDAAQADAESAAFAAVGGVAWAAALAASGSASGSAASAASRAASWAGLWAGLWAARAARLREVCAEIERAAQGERG